MHLTNKIVVITGASSGIGEAIAKRLAPTGAKLILAARRTARLEALAQELQEQHACACLVRSLDVCDRAAIHAFIDMLPKEWQAIDVLINNAGLALALDPLQTGDEDHWDTMIDTNLKGLLSMTRAVLPGMIERDCGHIVNLGSIAGQECYPRGNVYAASKHAVRAISKSLRLDLSGTAIRVTEIAPGAVETEFSIVRFNDAAKAQAFYQDFTPLIGDDIADAINYCITRPAHVDITEMTIMPTAQASATVISRQSKTKDGA